MALRDKLNEHPGASAAGVGVIIVLIIVFIVLSMRGEGGSSGPKWLPNKAFFSDDDGKTYFVDDITNIPPFQHNGRNAYRAQVFLDSNDHKFVGFLESYDPATKSKIESEIKSGKPVGDVLLDNPPNVKKPGGSNWAKPKDGRFPPEYKQVIMVTSPDKKAPIKGQVHVTSDDLEPAK